MSVNTNVKTATFGGNGGSAFEAHLLAKELYEQLEPMISLRAGSRVDQIEINGVTHGDPTNKHGKKSGELDLNNDYINHLAIRSGSEIDYVKFGTKSGNSIEGGGTGGKLISLSNIRVIASGGRSGSRVDRLDIFLYS